MQMDSFLKRLSVGLSFAVLSFSVQAFTPSKDQIELFKRLSPEQQEALAEKYNLDLGALGISSDMGPISKGQQEFVLPRQKMEQGFEEEPENGEFKDENEEELKPFGYDLFAGQPTTFAPLSQAPVPASYLLGVGDSLQVTLYGKENQQYDLQVDSEGKVSLPGLQPLQVAGMSYAEVKAYVREVVEKQFIGVNASVSFGELGNIRVMVVGDVYTPGSFIIGSLSTVTHALYAAGGIKESGSLRNIALKRSGQTIGKLDLYDLLLSGDNSDDLMLQSGDVVFVSTAGQTISIDGEVKRPAIYEIKGNESYKEVLSLAGGFTQSAYKENVFAYSYSSGVKLVSNLNLSTKAAQAMPLAENTESIYVYPASQQYRKSVQLIGAVEHPGYYQWNENIRLSDIFREQKSSFTENADLKYAVVMRETLHGISFIQFQPEDVVSNKAGDADIELMADDKVLVFSIDTGHQQLLSFSDFALDEAPDELIKLRTEEGIEQSFFWDLYSGIKNGDNRRRRNKPESDLPTLYELENDRLKDLVDKYSIYQWDKSSRQYLLWEVYRKVLQTSEVGKNLPLVEIRGNVLYPGVYPVPRNAKLADLIEAAGGLNDLAADTIKVSRIGLDSSVKQYDVAISETAIFDLNGRDAISVFQKEDSADFVSVELRGEVKFPGRYSIKRGDSLSDLVSKAGGFTDFAYLEGAIFTREELKDKERANLDTLANDLRKQLASKKLTQNSLEANTTSYAELKQVLSDLTDVDAVGRMVIDLPEIVDGQASDIAMERGDVLYVPARSDTISVVGEVYLPTSHRFTTGITTGQYIDMSGGIKTIGDEENIYIVKANGAVVLPEKGFWFSEDKHQSLQAGDTIVVPMDAAPVDNLTLWSQATQILYQMSLAVVAIGKL